MDVHLLPVYQWHRENIFLARPLINAGNLFQSIFIDYHICITLGCSHQYPRMSIFNIGLASIKGTGDVYDTCV